MVNMKDHLYYYAGLFHLKCLFLFKLFYKKNIINNFFRCAHNFQGNRCQISFNPDIYGYSIDKNEVETAAFSTLVTVLIIFFLLVSCCFYIYKR